MRRYTITVNDTPYELQVQAVTQDRYVVEYDGRSIDVRVDDHSDIGRADIAPGVQVRSAGSHVAAPERRAVTPTPPPPRQDPVHPAAAAPATGAPAPAGAGTLTAPMPGVILSVEAPVGTHVERGDTVLVLEAMKMKNALKAAGAGTVAAILVTEGQQVKYGDPLATIEA